MTFSNSPSPGVTLQGGGGSGGGGGGTPGGSSGQVQYNNASAFGGMSGTSWDDTNRSLTITGAIVTTSNPIFNLTQTWNAGGVTFTGWKLNVTDTASATASTLMQLQVGGSDRLKLTKNGSLVVTPLNNTTPCLHLGGATGDIIMTSRFGNSYFGGASEGDTGSSSFLIEAGTVTIKARSTGRYGFTSNASSADATIDTMISRRTAANLQLGAADAAAPVPQLLSVQSVVAGTSNTAGAAFTITGSQGTGSGAGGSIIFQVAAAGAAPTVQNALIDALTIKSGETLIGAGGSPLITLGHSSASTSARIGFYGGVQLMNSTLGGVSALRVTNSGTTDVGGIQFGGTTSSFPAIKRSTTFLQARLADDSAFTNIQGKLTTETAYTAGAVVVTGYLTLYDSTGTAYRVPCLV